MTKKLTQLKTKWNRERSYISKTKKQYYLQDDIRGFLEHMDLAKKIKIQAINKISTVALEKFFYSLVYFNTFLRKK